MGLEHIQSSRDSVGLLFTFFGHPDIHSLDFNIHIDFEMKENTLQDFDKSF